MARGTPEEAFAEASAAMARGDWPAFFACIDRKSLLRIAENGINRFLAGGPAASATFAALCDAQGVAAGRATALQALGARIVASGQAMRAGARTDPAAMVQNSLQHQKLVTEYRDGVKALAGEAPNLAAFVAALETALRAESGGGSVSSRLFLDETLGEVVVTGNKARATRRMASGATEDVSFAREKGQWVIKPFARI